MSDSSHRAWLKGELPGLVQRELLDEAAAARLRAHYSLDAAEATGHRMAVALAVMGGGLISAGVILLFANNWDELSRPGRAGLLLALLLAAQGLAGFALAKRPDSQSWREGTALFLTGSVGAALALISQTYHVVGELGDFMLSWILLAVPVAYLLSARATALLLCGFALSLPLGRDYALDEGYVFVPVMAALAPMLISSLRKAPGEHLSAGLYFGFVASALFGALLLVGRDAPTGVVCLFLFGGLALAHGLPLTEGSGVRRVAALVVVFAALAWSFEGMWDDARLDSRNWSTRATVAVVAALVLGAIAVARLLRSPRRDEDALVALSLVPAWLGYGLSLLGDRLSVVAAALMNLYMLGLGLSWLVRGFRQADRGWANMGLGVLSLLFLVRFLDSDISFVVRGLAMIAVGVAFLAVNFRISRAPEQQR